ncbi:uncharacterized protein LOC109599933 isoform X2 [Aethina tumida]|uniref:uncharacterized protein LOC109599933 isoform X2 n=1 Tax=Aethina tumida TaxID=116153 RepID=UPI0021486369|nr:uncharacterized protein LOC109599933 isoform X2 [Aethina tumida]
MNSTMPLKFLIGEKLHTVTPDDVTPETTLNAYLREKVQLMGTKRMCLEGGCGCCVVAVEHVDPVTKTNKIFAVNSCLVSIFSCQNWKIHTIEGIGNPIQGYHRLQKALAEGNGSQCGFCSGGMVMNMFALTKNGPVSAETIENSFGGNICRCTGYRPIIDSFRKFATTNIEDIEDFKLCPTDECQKLCTTPCHKSKPTTLYDHQKSKWMKVYNFNDLLETISETADTYRLVAGNTARGVYKHDPLPKTYIDVTSVLELISWKLVDNTLILGGNISLNETIRIFQNVSKQNSKLLYLGKLADHIDLIANVPVRNIGTIAGNLMLKHIHQEFPSDIFLILETVAATLVIVDSHENETRVTPEHFLKINMNKKLIKHIIFSGTDDQHVYTSYKIMPRAQNVHAVVNAGFFFKLKHGVVSKSTIVYGGINSEFVHARETEKYLINKSLFDNQVLQGVYGQLENELKPDYVLPDDTPQFRKNLAIALFYKFVLSIAPSDKLSDRNRSGGTLLQRPLSSGVQDYSSNKKLYPLSEPLVKLEALAQTSGQAEYIEDMPDRPGQLFVQFVKARAPPSSMIKKIDPSAALKLPGVVTFYDHNDIPGENNWTPKIMGPIVQVKEELFCSGKVQYFDQAVGIIVAKSQEIANEAADLVVVTYTATGQKPLLNVRDVLNAPQDVQNERIKVVTTHNAKRKGNDVKKVVKGEFFIDMQYHFHMEVQCCSVVPVEDGLNVYSATQWMDSIQIGIANVLGISQTKVNMQVRRLGGSFGGKLLRNGLVSVAAALAAAKQNKPVKFRLDLERNMSIIGKRLPLYVKYEVGVDNAGVIQYMDSQLYSDNGSSENEAVDPLIVNMFPSGYISDTWNFKTHTVKTDTSSNCSARAPGTAEGLAAIEAIMEHVATELGMDPYQLKFNNFNKDKHKLLVEFSSEMESLANVTKRKQDAAKFNKENRWKKRGISVVPMVWPYDVHSNFAVIVSIFHSDGSVAIAHGGIEMGQGINTKVAQVCAYKLGIPIELVSVKPSNTLANPNSFASGGSNTTESVCWALLKCCDILLDRMKPIKDKMINPTWVQLVNKCHDEYVFLSANSILFHQVSCRTTTNRKLSNLCDSNHRSRGGHFNRSNANN